MSVTGTVFDIQKCSIHDGPGIRTTVFLKGCPLRCLWCHNPESNSAFPELMFHSSLCTGCGRCIPVCGKQCITMGENGKSLTDHTECVHCGSCVQICPSKARTLAGSTMDVEQVMKRVLDDRIFYTDGGGVTFSGGEPLMQAAFLSALLDRSRAEGLHTAIETSAYAPWETAGSIFAKTDLLLIDIKKMDPSQHKRLTRVENTMILDNISRAAKELDAAIWIRMPLIAGVNDSEEEILKVRDFLLPIRENIKRVCFLAYHTLGMSKLEALGRSTSVMAGFSAPDAGRLEALSVLLKDAGFDVRIS